MSALTGPRGRNVVPKEHVWIEGERKSQTETFGEDRHVYNLQIPGLHSSPPSHLLPFSPTEIVRMNNAFSRCCRSMSSQMGPICQYEELSTCKPEHSVCFYKSAIPTIPQKKTQHLRKKIFTLPAKSPMRLPLQMLQYVYDMATAYISAKEAYINAEELYVTAKEPYTHEQFFVHFRNAAICEPIWRLPIFQQTRHL